MSNHEDGCLGNQGGNGGRVPEPGREKVYKGWQAREAGYGFVESLFRSAGAGGLYASVCQGPQVDEPPP